MKDAIKLMFMPIVGSTAIALIFILVVWAGNYQERIENPDGRHSSASQDVAGYAVMLPTECDNSYFPVCGFDGQSYDNACKAVAARTKVAHRGVCQG